MRKKTKYEILAKIQLFSKNQMYRLLFGVYNVSFVPLPSNKLPGAGCSQEAHSYHPDLPSLHIFCWVFRGSQSCFRFSPHPFCLKQWWVGCRVFTLNRLLVFCHCTVVFTIAVSHSVLIVFTGKTYLVNDDQCLICHLMA